MEGGGERRWNEVKGNSAAWPTIHHAWSLALTARYRSFFTQTAPPSFSNPPPRVSSLSRNRGQFFESRSSASLERFSKNGTREREREREKTERLVSTYIFLLDTRIHGIDIVPSRGHSFPTKASSDSVSLHLLIASLNRGKRERERVTGAERNCEA